MKNKDILSVCMVFTLTFASLTEAKGQVIDRKLMKDWAYYLDDSGLRGSKWKARKIKENLRLKGDTLLCYSWDKRVPRKNDKQIYNTILSWIKRTSKSNNINILKEDEERRIITTQWNLNDVTRRSWGNITYGFSFTPCISFECRNGIVRVTYALDKYLVLKEYDRHGYIVDGSKDYRKWELVWLIKDAYPYMMDSKLPKAATSKALVAVYCSMKEVNQLLGEALGVTKKKV